MHQQEPARSCGLAALGNHLYLYGGNVEVRARQAVQLLGAALGSLCACLHGNTIEV